MKALVNHIYLLEKIPGKGGWTYAKIPEIKPDSTSPFGWVKVKGSIDGVPIHSYHLMPMGNGSLFLPVKAEIRKKIKKEAGDTVHVILYPDRDALKIPEELQACLETEPKALAFFKGLSEAEQKLYIQWIFSAKKEETKIARLASCLDRLLKHQKFTATKS